MEIEGFPQKPQNGGGRTAENRVQNDQTDRSCGNHRWNSAAFPPGSAQVSNPVAAILVNQLQPLLHVFHSNYYCSY
jgi:hypothetical protein